MPKKKITGTIRTDTYAVFSRAVEEGVIFGWNHAHKHTDSPGDDTIKDEIYEAVLSSVCEFFFFDRSEI
jgi:hypothetical protein